MARVLIVDDDERVRSSLTRVLGKQGMSATAAGSAEEALEAVDRDAPDLVISDVRMPGMDGLELLRALDQRAPSVDVILMTAYDDLPTVSSAMRDGAIDLLVKPLPGHERLRDLRPTATGGIRRGTWTRESGALQIDSRICRGGGRGDREGCARLRRFRRRGASLYHPGSWGG